MQYPATPNRYGIFAMSIVLAVIVTFAGIATAETQVSADSAEARPTEATATHNEAATDGVHHGPGLGELLPLWSIIPFVGILLSIALFPLFAPHWWHAHFPKVTAFWAIVFAVPFLLYFKSHAVHEILHIYMLDYFPFIILLWSLYTVSAGVLVKGTMKGSPRLNIIFLVIGTVMASWVGTTGASMILIRPVLRANAWRRNKTHIVIFFIFLVSNIGGSLTPLGDPPLFLGFLHSVPFFWTLNLFLPMMTVALPLLAIFFLIDTLYYRREEQHEAKGDEPFGVEGLHNFLFLMGVISAVLMSGTWKAGTFHLFGVELKIAFVLRDAILIAMGVLSLKTTRKAIYERNGFTWFPIKEVGYLFAGIFMTIIPALAILKSGEHGALAAVIAVTETPAHYFWITGGLSSFLDNAPTYLTFFNTALGSFYSGIAESEAVPMLIRENAHFLMAISTGAVFMGAMTYIGNAPNFMVKSIAEEAGIPMPSFFGYMAKYSLPVLIPVFILVTLVFFK